MKLGLIGETLGHSQSPAIHEKIFRLLGIEGTYELLEIKRGDLAERLRRLQEDGYDGVNVTIPYKRDVMPFLGHISREAAGIGAVNTIALSGGAMSGYNTDYTGFGRSLDAARIGVSGKRCVVLGTGGAARAVLQCLADKGAEKLAVVSRRLRDDSEFAAFAQRLGAQVLGYEEMEDVKGGDILVNCTPVGMYPHEDESPLTADMAASFAAVVDLIYNPKETRLLRYAREQGAKTLNGMYMLVAQAVGAEEIWLGRPIDAGVVAAVVKEMEG